MDQDVLIIGGGVIGLSIARELHKSGVRRITLVEKGQCGTEASWAAAGMLGPQAEANESGPFFELCCSSRDLYPDLAAELLNETGVDIELDRSGTLYLAFTDDDVAELRERFEWQRKAGLAVEHLSAADIRKLEPLVSHDIRVGLFFPHDWQVENRNLLVALRRYAELNAVEIRENTKIERLLVENGRVAGAETDAGRITADRTVLATGAWTSLIKLGPTDLPFEVKPVRGQMIAFRNAKRLFQRVIYSRRGYIVPRNDGRILAGSTTENVGFDRLVTAEASIMLRELASEISPGIGKLKIADQWAGLRPQTFDGLPIIGAIDGLDDLFIATAHYRNGILLAPITAKLAADKMIRGDDSEQLRIFGPDRFDLLSKAIGN